MFNRNRNNEEFAQYAYEISRFPQLTRQEEIDLGNRILKGDETAIEKLIESNLPLVVFIARRFFSHGMTLNDMIQEGNIGLMKAAKTFDVRKNIKFSSYAVWYIFGYIKRAMAFKSRLVRQPVNFQLMNARLRKKFYEAQQLGKPFKEKIPKSLREHGEYDPEQFSFKEVPLDWIKKFSYIPQDIQKMEQEDELNELMVHLNIAEKKLIRRYFGFDSKKRSTLREISETLGVSTETVRQMILKALCKMKPEGF